ncbi:MAG: thiol:disulfide interchange protein, partial [Myxococcaceae bacterium]|nr:thiol:disulfide interchange protein [Myxococcaceae bacterium]
MDPGWHIYWRNAGEAGLPSEVELRVAGAEVGPLQFPFPETVRDPAGVITTYGHHDEVLLFRELRLPAGAGETVALEARVDVLV